VCDRDGPGRPSYDADLGIGQSSTDICLQQTWADPDRPNRLLYNTRTSGKPPYQWKYGTHRREFLPSKGSAGRSKIHWYKNISPNEAIEGRLREQMSSEVRNPLSSTPSQPKFHWAHPPKTSHQLQRREIPRPRISWGQRRRTLAYPVDDQQVKTRLGGDYLLPHSWLISASGHS